MTLSLNKNRLPPSLLAVALCLIRGCVVQGVNVKLLLPPQMDGWCGRGRHPDSREAGAPLWALVRLRLLPGDRGGAGAVQQEGCVH